MSVARWCVQDKQLYLRIPSEQLIRPRAMDIFRACFDGLREVEGYSVESPTTDLPSLKFSKYPAKPAVRVFDTEGGLAIQVGVRIGALVCSISDGDDQIIADGQWYPIQPAPYDALRKWCCSVGVLGSGTLSVGALIAIRTRADRPAELLDQVGATSETLATHARSKFGPVEGLHGELYPYQVEGVNYLRMMAQQGVGCVLGDEMGLGKTLQVIALIQAERNEGRGPSLIVAPATLLENWRREFKTFAPQLSVHVHAGANRAGIATRLHGYDVVAVSYDTAIRDEALMESVFWNLVALDEAQNIKNPAALRTISVKKLRRRVSIAVSGTPLENHLDDLWSITDFALPGLLGNLASFQKEFSNDLGGASRVSQLVGPAILRRRVTEVAKDLPSKLEIPQPLQMSKKLAEGYENLRHEVLKEYGAAGALVATTKLRGYCAHPLLSTEWLGDPADDMAKYARLIEILEEVFSNGEKALIFSTYNGMADLFARDLPRRFRNGFFQTIDGRLPISKRQETVDALFAHQGFGALFLNPKAAGTGLNITAANHVIHYNPEWNPALTDQASARAYRRKQERPVTIHHLYFVDRVEQIMIERASFKRQLAQEAVTGHGGDVEPLAIAHALQISPIARSLSCER